MREVKPGVWELVVEAGRDPVSGKYKQVTRRFHGTYRAAKTARANLLTEVTQGRHSGTRATVDQLVVEWLRELERKDRSPRTIDEYRRRYEHDIRNYLGTVAVSKVTTKMLTDLYGAHQRRGAAPASVRKIHATVSSMMSQACRWGWRDSNPATWADPPPIDQVLPVVPTPDEVRQLLAEAAKSQRPEHAEVMYLAATTGARRGEICAIRLSRINWDAKTLVISRNIVKQRGQKIDRPTKNRRNRTIAVDDRCLRLFRDQLDAARERAEVAGVDLIDDPYVLTVSLTGDDPWDPDTITQFFARVRKRLGLDAELKFHGFRRFMDTYGQELGFSLAQVSIRAGHDPAVASKHYTGKVAPSDRAIAGAIANLIRGDVDSAPGDAGDRPETAVDGD